MAIATLQQKFADKYLGGIDLEAFAVRREGGREGGRGGWLSLSVSMPLPVA
jgi:hypothetical protein